jgi:isopenicillin N synthase-like dioxygenase
MTAVPVLNLPKGVVSASIASELVACLQQRGYCYLRHPALTSAAYGIHHTTAGGQAVQPLDNINTAGRVHEDIRLRSRWFFDPKRFSSVKDSVLSPSCFRGYYRYIGASGTNDEIECFSVGRETEEPIKLREPFFIRRGWQADRYAEMLGRRNAWPNISAADPQEALQAREFKDDVIGYYDACHEMSMAALQHIACGLGLGAEHHDYFSRHHSQRDHNLELKYYPASVEGTVPRSAMKKPKKIMRRTSGDTVIQSAAATPSTTPEKPSVPLSTTIERLSSHQDLSSVTLLAQDRLGGLEVLDSATNTYVTVPVLEDALLLNAGIFLEKWTDGAIPATPHRVTYRRDAGDRCSVVFFAFPDFDALIEPLGVEGADPNTCPSFYAGDMMPTPG